MDNWELYYRTHKGKGSNTKASIPPLTFVSNGENLADYRIDGNTVDGESVGDRTKNLFDGELYKGTIMSPTGEEGNDSAAQRTRCRSGFIRIEPDCDYTISVSHNLPGWVLVYDQNFNKVYRFPEPAGDFEYPSEYYPMTIHTLSTGCYLRFVVAENISKVNNAQLEKGSTRTAYEPYGYKVPIVCGGTTTNIYLDEPLDEGKSISMSDTGIAIPTINGSNTLSIGTAVQPSKVFIKYGGSSNVNQSLMRYLEYKYDFSKE